MESSAYSQSCQGIICYTATDKDSTALLTSGNLEIP